MLDVVSLLTVNRGQLEVPVHRKQHDMRKSQIMVESSQTKSPHPFRNQFILENSIDSESADLKTRDNKPIVRELRYAHD